MDMKSKRERFETVASKRVQKVLDSMDILSNCANTKNYEYNNEDLKKMFSVLRNKLRELEMSFEKGINKDNKNKFRF